MGLETLLLAVCCALAPEEGASAGPVARLTRLADPVAYLDAEAGAEKMLFHWEKSAAVRVGDGVRQGVAGSSDLFFPVDYAQLRLFGSAHLIVEAVSPTDRVLRFKDLRRVVVELKSVDTRIILPGGTEIRGSGTWFRITRDEFDRHWLVRNAGPSELTLAGPVVPPGVAALAAGETVKIPIVEEAPAVADQVADSWDGKVVRLDRGVRATKTATELLLEGQGVAHVGGARIRLTGDGKMRIWRPLP